jgi:hypothetical protein
MHRQRIFKSLSDTWKSYLNSGQATVEALKRDWEEECAMHKKEKTYQIEHYSHGIRNEIDYYDQTFEEKEEAEAKREKDYEDEVNAIYIDKTKPEYTNTMIEYDNL